MSEELIQRDLLENPPKIGSWDFYNIGSTTVKALKKAKIIKNLHYGVESNKVDGLVMEKHTVIAVIENKTPEEFKSFKQQLKAVNQELNTATAIGSKIYIVTDGTKTIWINALSQKTITNVEGNDITDTFNPKDEDIIELMEQITISITKNNNQIKAPKIVNPTKLAHQIWQIVWAVSGATPEKCLYTFVELFIFKYLSDLNILQGGHSFNDLMTCYDKNTENEVLERYANDIRPKIKKLFPNSITDNTTIINGTIFVSKDQNAISGYSHVFKDVLTKFEKFGKLEHIDHDFKSMLFESFLKESISKKNWGRYFTPLKVVKAITNMSKDEIKSGIKICDPACGVGKFLLEAISKNIETFYTIKKNKLISNITIHGFDKGFDKEEQMTIILAKANMLIYFSNTLQKKPTMTKEFSKLFNNSFTLKTDSILGTISDPINDEYDLILTNPPYVMSGSGSLKKEIKNDTKLMKHYNANGMGIEGLFVEWIVKALKAGGKAFVVVPDGILNRQHDDTLRKFILNECYLDAIISLPEKTFFTTTKKTYIMAITKKLQKSKLQTDPVFTYLVSEIGESRDVYRFEIEQNDLSNATQLFTSFKGNKNGFEKLNDDKRCKIQPISLFKENSHWSVDRMWPYKEKIELGIIEEIENINPFQFKEILTGVSDDIMSLSETLNEMSDEKS